MSFYQSQVWKAISTEVLKKPLVEVEWFGEIVRGTLKQQRKLGKDFRRWMIHGIQFPEKVTHKQRDKQVDALKSQLVHGWGDFLLQVGLVNTLSVDPTSLVKKDPHREHVRSERIALQDRLLQSYDLEVGLRKHMPDATITIDLSKEALRTEYSTSCKRSINKGKKAELSFEQATREQRELFREVRYPMSYDKGFSVLPKDQLLALRDYLMEEDRGWLHLATQDGKIVSGVIYVRYGKQLVYLYGATDRSYGNIGAQYRLTDQVLQRGVGQGYASCDLRGVAPVGMEQGHDREGVTRYKQSFGGETVSYRGSYDLVFNPWVMKMFEWKRKASRTRKFKIKSGK